MKNKTTLLFFFVCVLGYSQQNFFACPLDSGYIVKPKMNTKSFADPSDISLFIQSRSSIPVVVKSSLSGFVKSVTRMNDSTFAIFVEGNSGDFFCFGRITKPLVVTKLNVTLGQEIAIIEPVKNVVELIIYAGKLKEIYKVKQLTKMFSCFEN